MVSLPVDSVPQRLVVGISNECKPVWRKIVGTVELEVQF